jgi:hypothetical protein
MLMRLLAGVEKPQSGSIKLDGKDIAQARREKGKVVRIDAQVQPKPVKAGKPTGDAGAKVRQAIAKARAERPKLILLDAPSTGLQLEAREQFLADFKSPLADTGAVIVLVAGDADEALGLGGNVGSASRRDRQSGPARMCRASCQPRRRWRHPSDAQHANDAGAQWPRRAGRWVEFQPPDELRLPDDGRCTWLPSRRHDVGPGWRWMPVSWCGRHGEKSSQAGVSFV